MKTDDSNTTTTTIMRDMTCELGQITRCDGDVCLMQGQTCVAAAVYGPTEVRMNKEILDKATVEVVYKSKVGLPGCAEKIFERIIRNTCETMILTTLHPRSGINIIIQEMQNSGSYLACCINSACLALLDAGISMKFLVAAVTCVIDDKEEVILDPTSKQEKNATALLTFVFDNKDFNVVTVNTKGSYSSKQFKNCLCLCKAAAKQVFHFYKKSMEKKLSKDNYIK